jgi:hypothetical protein
MSNIVPFGRGTGSSRALARQIQGALEGVDARAQVAHAQLLAVGGLTSQAVNDGGNLTAQCVEVIKQVPEAAPMLAPILRTYGAIAQQIIQGSMW